MPQKFFSSVWYLVVVAFALLIFVDFNMDRQSALAIFTPQLLTPKPYTCTAVCTHFQPLYFSLHFLFFSFATIGISSWHGIFGSRRYVIFEIFAQFFFLLDILKKMKIGNKKQANRMERRQLKLLLSEMNMYGSPQKLNKHKFN